MEGVEKWRERESAKQCERVRAKEMKGEKRERECKKEEWRKEECTRKWKNPSQNNCTN